MSSLGGVRLISGIVHYTVTILKGGLHVTFRSFYFVT